MSRLITGAVTASLTAIVLAAEMTEPGVTFLFLFAVAKFATLLLQAAIWPLGFFGFGWLMWKGGEMSGHRDALQEVAQKAVARTVRLRAYPQNAKEN